MKIKNNKNILHKGFTLIEIIIAIMISLLIIWWTSAFLLKIQKDIIASQEKTIIYTNLSDFISTIRNFTKLYETGSLVVDGTGYDVILMMKHDKSAGALIGVVEQGNSGSLSLLDPLINKDVYGKKIIAYQRLTNLQINTILTDTGSVYAVNFSNDGLFKELLVTDFSITPYNNNSIFEYKINVEVPYSKQFAGKLRSTLYQDITNLSFTLDF